MEGGTGIFRKVEKTWWEHVALYEKTDAKICVGFASESSDEKQKTGECPSSLRSLFFLYIALGSASHQSENSSMVPCLCSETSSPSSDSMRWSVTK